MCSSHCQLPALTPREHHSPSVKETCEPPSTFQTLAGANSSDAHPGTQRYRQVMPDDILACDPTVRRGVADSGPRPVVELGRTRTDSERAPLDHACVSVARFHPRFMTSPSSRATC